MHQNLHKISPLAILKFNSIEEHLTPCNEVIYTLFMFDSSVNAASVHYKLTKRFPAPHGLIGNSV